MILAFFLALVQTMACDLHIWQLMEHTIKLSFIVSSSENRETKIPVWRCRGRMEKKKDRCLAHTIYEREIHEAVVRAFRQVHGPDIPIIKKLRKNCIAVIREEGDVHAIDKQMEKLQKEMVKRVNLGEEYSDLSEEIRKLQEVRDKALKTQIKEEEKEMKIRELTEFLKQHKDTDLEYNDLLVREHIERIEAFDEKLVFTFKAGAKIEVEY